MKVFTKLTKLEVASVLLVALVSAVPAWAQTANTAIVLGTVMDKANAVVPDASVELVNTATNDTKTATSNGSGQYVFPTVAPGIYTLKITKAGFATTTFANIRV